MDDKLRLPNESDIQQVLNLEDVSEVPSFPPVMAKLLELCSDESASIDDLSRLVKTDPGISARIMRVVSHALYGRRQKITDVSEAVLHLGFDEVKKLALGVTVFENMFKTGRQRQFDRRFFWRHCLCVAALSSAVAREIRFPRPGEAYIGGLLHDLGKIIFDVQGRVNYDDFVNSVARQTGPLISEERDLMGMGHDDLGAYYCKLWGLPQALALTVRYHHRRFHNVGLDKEEAQLIAIVSLANFLAWTQGIGSFDIIRPPILQPEVERYIEIGRIDFKKLIRHMDRELENTSRFYKFAFPSPSEFRENLLRANLRLSRIHTGFFFNGQQAKDAPDLSGIQESLTTPHRSLDTKKIISGTLRAIYNDFHFDRIYVLKMVKRLRRLKVIDCLDTTRNETDLKSIEIRVNRDSGRFIHCLRYKEPAMIRGKTPGEKLALQQFGTPEMAIVPFYSHRSVLGILGMDNVTSGLPIPPDVISAVAFVANELGVALENAAVYHEAKSISRRDGLTGLLNRLAINELLAKSFRQAMAGKNQMSLVMIDVDFFKKFNDKFGHQTGDSVLKLLAAALNKLSRPFDHVGRYGGEEFIVILNHTDLANAMAYADRIRKEIETMGKMLKKRFPGLSLTVSAGLSTFKSWVRDTDDLIARADQALYRAKQRGRNRVMAD